MLAFDRYKVFQSRTKECFWVRLWHVCHKLKVLRVVLEYIRQEVDKDGHTYIFEVLW